MWKTALALFVFTGPLSAGTAAAAPTPSGNLIYVYGNHIFDDDTILSEAGLTYPGSSPDPKEIRDRLVSTGHFSRVVVTLRPGRTVITVREKQPDFLLPYFASSSERKYFGLAGGALGFDEGASELLARYQIGTGDHEASALYRKDYVVDGFSMVGGTFQYQDALRDVYSGRDVAYSFGNREYDFTLATGYHFQPGLFVGFDTHYEIHRFEGTDGREVRGDQLSHRFYAEYGILYQDEGIVSGFKLKPYLEVTNPLSTFSFLQWGLLGRFAALRKGDVNWVITPRYEAGQFLPLYQQFELGGPKLRGFPSEIFRTQRYVSVQNDLTVARFDISEKFIVRPLVFADWAYVNDGGRPGAGVGINVFFRHVSVPAIQIAAGYGTHPAGFSVAAAIGPQL